MSTNLSAPSFFAKDWISQADAARIRKVSKQAIFKLIQKGRIRRMKVGGHVLVHKFDAENFQRNPPGRPKRGRHA